jgi:anti-sigma factor (TIGR02949 family)
MGGNEPEGAMPECREMFERLSDYLDGDLPLDVCERYARHIEGCSPCVRFVESLRRAVRLVERSPELKLPEDLRDEILASARRLRGADEDPER